MNLRGLKGAGGLRDDYDYTAMRAGNVKSWWRVARSNMI